MDRPMKAPERIYAKHVTWSDNEGYENSRCEWRGAYGPAFAETEYIRADLVDAMIDKAVDDALERAGTKGKANE